MGQQTSDRIEALECGNEGNKKKGYAEKRGLIGKEKECADFGRFQRGGKEMKNVSHIARHNTFV